MRGFGWGLSGFLLALVLSQTQAQDQDYRIHDEWIRLSDGVRLAVTYYTPVAQSPEQKFPILLELLPYRKDDLSLGRFHPHYDYFARHGLALARVDIRGTGSSEGTVPAREYSDVELDDAEEVIAALAGLPWSNGRVGMWGISWGGFNALQVAMRQPPQLAAILAAHASDDLYLNDVHFPDGTFGLDEYHLSINHMNGMPKSPDYALDADYFAQRFDREPWLFNTLRNARDGPFWRAGSLKYHYDELQVPVFLINGLLDGYRDTAAAALTNLSVPVEAVVGPWNHAWPDAATPGPNWDWRMEALAWWRHWLQDEPATADYADRRLRVFVRGGHAPATDLAEIPGDWVEVDWRLNAASTRPLTLYPSDSGSLTDGPAPDGPDIDILVVDPTVGQELGEWFGELRPDLRGLDGFSLVYDSARRTEPLRLIGQPEVSLRVSADAVRASWVVRLENIDPAGQVTVVTGAARNGLLAGDPLGLDNDRRGEHFLLRFPLHFTTWTFQPGHRIRLSISNSAFPMIWPAPGLRVSSLLYNDPETLIELPVWEPADAEVPIAMPQPTEVPAASESAATLSYSAVPWIEPRDEIRQDRAAGSLSVLRDSGVARLLNRPGEAPWRIESGRHTRHTTFRSHPEDTEYEAWMETRLLPAEAAEATIRYRTEIELNSDAREFTLRIVRTLWRDGQEIRRREWAESYPRDLH